MMLVWDEDFHQVEGPVRGGFLCPHLDLAQPAADRIARPLARRQMELEGYAMTMRMTDLAVRLRRAINTASADLQVLPRREPRRK
jgi:arginine decarboxylase